MAQQTEAACLLESGAVYSRRLLVHPKTGDPIFAGLKTGAFSLYFGDAPIIHFDLEGRWQRAFLDGVHYLKGLDTVVQSIDRVREGENLVLKRRTLAYEDVVDLDSLVRGIALDLASSLDAGRLEFSDPPSSAQPLGLDDLRDMLERIAGWDASAWFAHRERYLAAYTPLPYLPPDCPNALVLQAVPIEFEPHVRAVLALMGRRIAQYKSIYLAGTGAEVLRRSVDEIIGYLDVARRSLPGYDVHAFLGDFSLPVRDPNGWRRLRDHGLARVSLGIASGDRDVRRRLGYEWEDDDLIAIVSALKAAEVGLGLIVPVWAGGEDHSSRHVEATSALINRLALKAGDLVSLLTADDLTPLGSFPPLAATFRPLTDSAREMQLNRLKSLLAPVRTVQKAKVAPFRLEKQGL